MKHLSILTAAIFLFAAPAAFAQSDNGNDNNNGGNGDNATDGNTNNQGNNNTGTSDQTDDGPNCPEVSPNQNFDALSEGCRSTIDAWVNEQQGAPLTFEGDVAVGTVLPGSVEIVEVPAYRGYGYARLNDKRVLVDRDTRTIVRVF